MTTTRLNYYARKFANLRVYRAHGIAAPHKPILLLSVLTLIEQGLLLHNRILLSAELIAAFLKLWSKLGSESHNADIGMPFFHLRGDGFWHFKPNPGFEALLSSGAKVRAVGVLRQALEYAYLDEELFEILQNPQERSILTRVLIDSWFTDKTVDIEQLLQVNAFGELQETLQRSGGKVYQPEELEDEQTTIVRDATFRRVIVSTYEYRCAFCGLQIIDSKSQNVVDGAHIKPFSKFYDDRIDNGLSLCKTHHWAFDRGWFSLNNDYTIVVADNLREDSPNARPMGEFSGDRLNLPSQQQYYPRLEALQWHRENVFGAA